MQVSTVLTETDQHITETPTRHLQVLTGLGATNDLRIHVCLVLEVRRNRHSRGCQ